MENYDKEKRSASSGRHYKQVLLYSLCTSKPRTVTDWTAEQFDNCTDHS
jgi:hypothetical protein